MCEAGSRPVFLSDTPDNRHDNEYAEQQREDVDNHSGDGESLALTTFDVGTPPSHTAERHAQNEDSESDEGDQGEEREHKARGRHAIGRLHCRVGWKSFVVSHGRAP